MSHQKDIPSLPRHNACPPPHTFLCCPLDFQYVPSFSHFSIDISIIPLPTFLPIPPSTLAPIPPSTLAPIPPSTLSPIPPSTLLPILPSTLLLIPPSILSPIPLSTLLLIPPSTLLPISTGSRCAQLVDGIVASGPDLSAGEENGGV